MKYLMLTVSVCLLVLLFGCSSINRSQPDILWLDHGNITKLNENNFLTYCTPENHWVRVRSEFSKEETKTIKNNLRKQCATLARKKAGVWWDYGQHYTRDWAAMLVCLNADDVYSIAYYCVGSTADLKNQKPHIAELLVRHKPQVLKKYSDYVREATPESQLILAILHEDSKKIRSLVNKGVNVNFEFDFLPQTNPYLREWRKFERQLYKTNELPEKITPLWLADSIEGTILLKAGADISYRIPTFEHSAVYYSLRKQPAIVLQADRFGDNERKKEIYRDTYLSTFSDKHARLKEFLVFTDVMKKHGFWEEDLNSQFEKVMTLKKAQHKERVAEKERLKKKNELAKHKEELAQAKLREKRLTEEKAKGEVFKNSFGAQICMNGELLIETRNRYGLSQTNVEGQAQGIVENVSNDSKRIQLRISGYWVSDQSLMGRIIGHPYMNNLELKPGTIYWSPIEKWSFCDIL